MGHLTTALERSKQFTNHARAIMPTGSAALAIGGGSALSALNRGASITQHAEQYRHYTDWVYAVVRVTGQRIAGQAFHVGVIRDKPEKRALPAGYKSKGRVDPAKRWRNKARTERNKRLLPGGLKSLADSIEVYDDHPFQRLMERPNPLMTRHTLIFITSASLDLTGKAYWWFVEVVNDDGEREVQVWPVPSSWIEPVHVDDEGQPHLFHHWKLSPNGAGIPIEVEDKDIVYFHDPDPSNPIGAVGTLQATAKAVVTDESISEAQRRQFSNGMNPGVLLTVGRHPDVAGVPGERPILTKAQRDQIYVAMKSMFQGVINHDEPLILDGLIQDAKRLFPGVREMDYPESGKVTKEKILHSFGVPATVMGQVELVNRATAATSDDIFCNNVVNPRLTQMSETATMKLGPRFSQAGERVVFFFEAAHAVDPESDRADEQFLTSQGAVARNELRARRGMEPIKEGNSCFVQGFGEVVIEPDDGEDDRDDDDESEGRRSSGRRFPRRRSG